MNTDISLVSRELNLTWPSITFPAGIVTVQDIKTNQWRGNKATRVRNRDGMKWVGQHLLIVLNVGQRLLLKGEVNSNISSGNIKVMLAFTIKHHIKQTIYSKVKHLLKASTHPGIIVLINRKFHFHNIHTALVAPTMTLFENALQNKY